MSAAGKGKSKCAATVVGAKGGTRTQVGNSAAHLARGRLIYFYFPVSDFERAPVSRMPIRRRLLAKQTPAALAAPKAKAKAKPKAAAGPAAPKAKGRAKAVAGPLRQACKSRRLFACALERLKARLEAHGAQINVWTVLRLCPSPCRKQKRRKQ